MHRLIYAIVLAVIAMLILARQMPLAAEPAEVKPEPLPEAMLPMIFDEDLSDVNRVLKEFKVVRPGEMELNQGQQWVWKEGIALVRPIRAGLEAELVCDIAFPPLTEEGQVSETRLGLVFGDQQVGTVALARQRKGDKVTGELRVVRQADRPRKIDLSVRSLALADDLENGVWTLQVKAGTVRLLHGEQELLAGCFETHAAPIIGVSLMQEKGQATVRRLTMRGSAFPEMLSADKQQLLAKASALNEVGKQHYQAKQFAEAATQTAAALGLYKQVHGDGHNDVANSHHNVAVVLRDAGQPNEAISHYRQAIAVRGKLFGPDHPDTALLEMELAALLFSQKRLIDAREPCTRANASFARFYGEENRLTQATGEMLRLLPNEDTER